MDFPSTLKLLFLLSLWSLASGEKSDVVNKPIGQDGKFKYDAMDIVSKSPGSILEMRGFGFTKHNVHTHDGYYINLVRIINPKLVGERLKRPVLFNHGLLESATIWLINSFGVEPMGNVHGCNPETLNWASTNGSFFLNGPMMLSNSGYDVWLLSMRGTDYSTNHDNMSYKKPDFWNYCLDDFALVDVPSSIDYIQKQTGASKVGYIGHSQATFSIFGLLAARPNYADIIEPVIAVAPVAFADHISSAARPLFLSTLIGTDKDQHGPFPPNALVARKALGKLCSAKDATSSRSKFCQLVNVLIAGNGERLLPGFYSHIPFYTSLKVLRHFGQIIATKRFTMYDYGPEENKRIYNTVESPSYPIENIKSKSLVLISTKADTLSPPEDVNRFRKQLKVPLYRDIFIDKEFDHFDLITDKQARGLVFKPILEIFEQFEAKSGVCSMTHPDASYHDILDHNFHQTRAKDTNAQKEWEEM